jgi:hypothetical protein
MRDDILADIYSDPFAPVIYKLRVPIRKGEVEYTELKLRSPVLGDLLMTDGHTTESVGYALALLSSLSGAPVAVLKKIVPEDYADLRLILALTNMRYFGQVNLLDKKEDDKTKGPTKAAEDTPPPSCGPTSAV